MSEPLVRWPRADRGDGTGVAVVTVSYNTRALIAVLLWSLRRLPRDQLRAVVVVDNGSSDGSRDLLEGAAEAGLCSLIANSTNRYHGPALNQALSHLAALEERQVTEPVGWVLALDSDCVVARPDVLTDGLAAAIHTRAALMGERRWDPWNRCDRLAAHTLLLDPAQVWRRELAPFEDGGDPSDALERSCVDAQLAVVDFPFVSDGYVIHRGRSSLAGVRARHETSNQLYEWATTHHEPHYELHPGAEAAYARLIGQFAAAVPHVDAEHLVRACTAHP